MHSPLGIEYSYKRARAHARVFAVYANANVEPVRRFDGQVVADKSRGHITRKTRGARRTVERPARVISASS